MRPAPRSPAIAVPGALLHLLQARQDAEQVLHVVADFIGNHISLGKLARLAGTPKRRCKSSTSSTTSTVLPNNTADIVANARQVFPAASVSFSGVYFWNL
jgi:hypothetical protein